MPTFIYAPGVKVYIKTRRNGLIEVSDDLVSGTMVRRSDGVSTFDFNIINTRRRYDGVFTPNDPIVVMMKRVSWLRVYTGLLNSVPMVSVWPRDVAIRSSCSLKRLQYWYFDPYTSVTQGMIQQALSSDKAGTNDGGMTNVILTILKKVVDWPQSKVHIAQIPTGWYKIAMNLAQTLLKETAQADQAVQAYLQSLTLPGLLSGDAASSTSGTSADGSVDLSALPIPINGRLAPGGYGGTTWSQAQLDIATMIYSVAKGMGLSSRDAMLGIMCAMQESGLGKYIVAHDGTTSTGIFMQMTKYYGQDAHNPQAAAKMFFRDLVARAKNRDSVQETVAIQEVQRSGFPNAYQKWKGSAAAIVAQLDKMATKGGAQSSAKLNNVDDQLDKTRPTPATSNPSTTVAGVMPTGASLVQNAEKLVAGGLRTYNHAGRSVSYITSARPTYADCSLFVTIAYYRATGKILGGNGNGWTVQTIDAYCKRAGAKRVSIEEAKRTAGAIVVRFGAPSNHVEISYGDGIHTIGSHSPSSKPQVGAVQSSWNFEYGWLLPGMTFPQGSVAVGDPGAATTGDGGLSAGGGSGGFQPPTTVPFSQTSAYNSDDPAAQLFADAQWFPDASASAAGTTFADSLTGVRALMNDQPVLPYIKNLFNASLRSFCSAPNGDLIAWFPDYYGMWKGAASIVIQPIELKDFTIDWSDDQMVTHMFTQVSNTGQMLLDIGTGQTTDNGIWTGVGKADMRVATSGIASIDLPGMMHAILGIDPGESAAKDYAKYVYSRFGARPAYEEIPGLTGPDRTFFSAVFKFMLYWSYQYNADVPTTFMPEAFPGMLLKIPSYGFQAYITTVTHTFNMGQGGGFNTTMNIAAPAKIADNQGNIKPYLFGLPFGERFSDETTSGG